MRILSGHWKLSVLERCPYREVLLCFFSSSIPFFLLSFFIFNCELKIKLSIISSAILLIQTRWVRVRAELHGANVDPSAGKRQNQLSYMCAFHGLK